MFKVQDLAQRFGLSQKSVRERLNALRPLVEPHIVRGRNNALLLSDAGLAIFDRLMQLEREGYPTAAAVQLIQNDGFFQKPTSWPSECNQKASCWELIIELRARIEEQARMIEYLKAKLDEAFAKLPALPNPRRSLWSRLLGR